MELCTFDDYYSYTTVLLHFFGAALYQLLLALDPSSDLVFAVLARPSLVDPDDWKLLGRVKSQ